jgi:hypothetical protein
MIVIPISAPSLFSCIPSPCLLYRIPANTSPSYAYYLFSIFFSADRLTRLFLSLSSLSSSPQPVRLQWKPFSSKFSGCTEILCFPSTTWSINSVLLACICRFVPLCSPVSSLCYGSPHTRIINIPCPSLLSNHAHTHICPVVHYYLLHLLY